MCECLNRIDEHLKAENTKLARSYVLDGPRRGMFPVLETKLIEKRRGAKPMTVIPTFYPFCGVKYPQADQEKENSHGE